jgi:hypothetical protein
VTNEEVFRRTGEKRSLWKDLVKRRDELIGRLLQHEGTVKTIMEGRKEGKNDRGRPRVAYIKQIMKDVGCTTYVEMKRNAERRAEWRAAIDQSLD